ncbi:hypothetical protein Zmor_008531 [Zophobas morio]|uniref:Uncharacterized protein n=1 Tax=Zophobas morio TaxID=2755281 RepID=A0AA38J0M4_9CUCU|nr:hypothetical protein Zmor_008531 [Zophobas morio]
MHCALCCSYMVRDGKKRTIFAPVMALTPLSGRYADSEPAEESQGHLPGENGQRTRRSYLRRSGHREPETLQERNLLRWAEREVF